MELTTLPIETRVTLGLAEVVGTADYGELMQLSAAYAVQVESLIVETADQEKLAIDSKEAVVKAYKRIEALRVQHVGYPTKLATEINKACKSLKDSLVSTKEKIGRKIQDFRDLEEKKRQAALIEQQAQERASAGEKSCATCLSLIRCENTNDCHMIEEGKVTIIGNIDEFSCPKWHHQIEMAPLPTEGSGEPVALESSTPEPPPPAENVVKTDSGASAHTRKQWTFKVTNFAKFVRAVGSNKKPELVAEDLLEVKRGALNKLIRREEDPVRKIPGLKISEEKVLV